MAAILDIAYDREVSGKDRLAAFELLDKTVLRCKKMLLTPARNGNWQELVDRAIVERIIAGDKDALNIAIASGKAEGYKLPVSGPSTAVQVNVATKDDPFAGMSEEKRARLSLMDEMLGIKSAQDVKSVQNIGVVQGAPPILEQTSTE